MSIMYDYDDPEKEWPCIGPMTVGELEEELVRCDQLLINGVVTDERYIGTRIQQIEEELLTRVYLRECHEEFVAGTRFPNGGDFMCWKAARS